MLKKKLAIPFLIVISLLAVGGTASADYPDQHSIKYSSSTGTITTMDYPDQH